MLILAIDQSTTEGSAALLEDETVLGALTWESQRNKQTGLDPLVGLLQSNGRKGEDVDLYAVGLGPGGYAGLRICLSTCLGLALPGDRPVVGVSSAEAVAEDLRRRHGCDRVTVVGDARRQRLWLGQFEADAERLTTVTPFRLIPFDEIATWVKAPGMLATSDWDRIGALLREQAPVGTTLIEAACLPQAEIIGQLAYRQTGGRVPAEKPTPTPIYLHPPVFVAPRFPKPAATAGQ